MNFYKSAVAIALVAMALTSCKGSKSDSPESPPPAEETISMAQGCKEAEPLLSELGDLFKPIVENVVNNESNDDNVARFNSILDEVDAIGNSVDTNKGRASFLSFTVGADKVLEHITNGKDPGDAFAEWEKTANALDEECQSNL